MRRRGKVEDEAVVWSWSGFEIDLLLANEFVIKPVVSPALGRAIPDAAAFATIDVGQADTECTRFLFHG